MSGIITAEAAEAHVRDHCANPLEVTTWGEPDSRWLCGCARCPRPDPTPAQLQRRVDDAAWQRVSSVEPA